MAKVAEKNRGSDGRGKKDSRDRDGGEIDSEASKEEEDMNRGQDNTREEGDQASNSDEDSDRPDDRGSDSSEDERPVKNTIGLVPLEWYKDEEHIGYDLEGQKIIRKEVGEDKIDEFLRQADDPKSWRTIYDDYNDEHIVLSKEEVDLIRRIKEGRVPESSVDIHEPYIEWMVHDGLPLPAATEPKRRFIPSKWEAKKVVKLVRAIRKGLIKTRAQKLEEEEKERNKPLYYDIWGDDQNERPGRTVNGLLYIPPPKTKLPGHEESYNPSKEYIPTEEDLVRSELDHSSEKPSFSPQAFDAVRKIPAYQKFIHERFERCLDLYLCPRTRKTRVNMDPKDLLPKLPDPSELRPFPRQFSLAFLGHTGRIRSLSVERSGQLLASASENGQVFVWDISTGCCLKRMYLNKKISQISWNPAMPLLAVAVETEVQIILIDCKRDQSSQNAELLLQKAKASKLKKGNKTDDNTVDDAGDTDKFSKVAAGIQWTSNPEDASVTLKHKKKVTRVSWHSKGDYFITICPEMASASLLVHQLSNRISQNPFTKSKGRIRTACFHPAKPFLFLATERYVRVYNLVKHTLARKFMPGVNGISSLALHPEGDNFIIGSDDRRVCWFDMDLSSKPYRTMKYHQKSVSSVDFHPIRPLFASSASDGKVLIFHGRIYSDLLQNPLIVPLKILRPYNHLLDPESSRTGGDQECAFHPSQPWVFISCGNEIQLWTE